MFDKDSHPRLPGKTVGALHLADFLEVGQEDKILGHFRQSFMVCRAKTMPSTVPTCSYLALYGPKLRNIT